MGRVLSISIVFALALVGCGGSSTNDAATGGSAGTGATAGSGGAGGSGGSSGTGASGGQGGSGGGVGGSGGSVCSGFDDEPAPATGVTIRIENAGTNPIYLGGGDNCTAAPLYGLSSASGPLALSAGNCDSTCQELQQHGPFCTGACEMPRVILVNPGGHYDTSWSGVVFQPENMPASCYSPTGYTPATCDRQVVPDAGSYSASATAGTALTCIDVSNCNCTPDASGSCEITFGGTLSGSQLAAKVDFDYPTSMVTLTFD
jgi:hypothetical protein